MTEEQQLITLEEAIANIRSQGYWEIIIQPEKFDKEHLKSQAICAGLVEKSIVQFRGWDYPHVGIDGIKNGNESAETCENWGSHLEYWRMSKTGQFFHLLALVEDWEDMPIVESKQPSTTPGYGLEPFLALFTLTEIYEFAARLAENNAFDNTIQISITLNGMKNRRLVSAGIQSFFKDDCICNVDKISIKKTVPTNEVVVNGKMLAIKDMLTILEKFHCTDVPIEILEAEQENLTSGKLYPPPEE